MHELGHDDLAAVVAIQRLQAAYGDAVTRRAWEEVVGLFEPDAVVHIDTRTRPVFELVGPQEITGFIERSLAGFRFFEFAILNSTVELDGEHATGRVYLCELRHAHDGAWTEAYGLYRDRYVRGHAGWRIAGRRYSSLARSGPPVESFDLPPDA